MTPYDLDPIHPPIARTVAERIADEQAERLARVAVAVRKREPVVLFGVTYAPAEVAADDAAAL